MTTPLIRRVACLSLLVAAPVSAQFRDLATRPKLDTAAISQFISSYRGRHEALYAKTLDKRYFGPLLTFSGRQFVSEANGTMPAEAATDLVMIGNSTTFGAVVGGLAGFLASLGAFASAASKNPPESQHVSLSPTEITLMIAGPLAGVLIGGLIGHYIPSEINAAPMNAFRTR
ncbi:MAG: hypothetical protein JSS75_11235 [Bacteroidetes bacterium]|nr:hypothetical protein [Bacteroidota bacterium]